MHATYLKYLLSLMAFLIFTAICLSSHAASFNIQQLSRPSPDAGAYVTIFGSQLFKPERFNFGITTDYAGEPLSLFNANGDKVQDVVGGLWSIYLLGDVKALDWLDFGLTFSTAPSIIFRAPNTATSNEHADLGDLRINSRVRLLDNTRFPVGIALIPFINLPTGSGTNYVGDDSVSGGGLISFDTKRLADRFSLALNVGYEARRKTALAVGTIVDDFILYGLGANLKLAHFIDLIAEMRGFFFTDDPLAKNRRPMEVGGYLRWNFEELAMLTFGASRGVLSGIGSPQYRITIGVSFAPDSPF